MNVMYECVKTRWQCDRGHFIAADSVQSEDIVDPGAYYGVVSRIWATCKVCGHVENPRLVDVGVEQVWGSS